jgi:hypothetical protein
LNRDYIHCHFGEMEILNGKEGLKGTKAMRGKISITGVEAFNFFSRLMLVKVVRVPSGRRNGRIGTTSAAERNTEFCAKLLCRRAACGVRKAALDLLVGLLRHFKELSHLALSHTLCHNLAGSFPRSRFQLHLLSNHNTRVSHILHIDML